MSNKTNHIEMTLVETINPNHLENIINNYDKLISSGFDIHNEENKEYYNNNLYEAIHKYKNRIDKKSKELGYVKVTYIPPKGRKKVKGRVYPQDNMGVVSFPRDIRNYLLHTNDMKPMALDSDIKNAHPTIYYQYLVLEENYPKEKLRHLENYINHRDEWIKIYGKKIKEQVIVALNCGELIKVNPNLPTGIDKLIREIWDSHNFLKQKYNLQHLEKIKSFVYDKNTTIERNIVNLAIEYIKEVLETDISIYAYDGFCIPYCQSFENQSFLDFLYQDISEYVYENTKVKLSDGTTQGYKIQFVNKPLEVNKKIIEIINSNKTTKQLEELENSIKINLGEEKKFLDDYIEENFFEMSEDIIIVKAPMGDGKSHKVYMNINQLRENNPKKPITSISILNRITLIDNLKIDYPFTYSYHERSKNVEKIDGIGKSTIICCESLHRLTSNTMINCDYLILDEIMSLIPQLQCTETHGENIRINQNYFFGLVRSVSKIIIMDANINQSTIDFIKSIRNHGLKPNPVVKSYEVVPRKPRNIYFYDSDSELIQKIVDDVSLGKKLFIVMTCNIDIGEGIITTIKNFKPDTKCLYINSETSNDKDIKPYVADTQRWSEFQVVMITPTICSGVSCVLKNHFNEVYGLLSSQSCNSMDASQMFGRVRYPTTNNIHINIKMFKHPKYNKFNMTPKRAFKMLYLNTSNLYKMNKSLVDFKFNYETFTEELITNHRTDLFIHNYVQQCKSYTLYEYNLRKSLENTYNCNFINTQETNGTVNIDEEVIEVFCDNEREIKNRKAKTIFMSNNLNDLEYEELKKNTPQDEFQNNPQVKKYFYGKKIGLSLDNLDNFISNNVETEGKDDEKTEGTKNDHGSIKKVIDSLIIPTRKIFKKMLFSSKSSRDCLKSLYQTELIFNNGDVGLLLEQEQKMIDSFFNIQSTLDFNLPELNNFKDMDTKDYEEFMKGQLTKLLWTQNIMSFCFNHKYLFNNLSITDEEFLKGFEKFKKFYYMKNKDYSHSQRLKDLFNIKYFTEKEFKKLTLSQIKQQIFSKLLNSVGLQFKSLNMKRKKIDGKLKYVNDGNVLTFIFPIRLDPRLPIKLEKISEKDIFLTENTLPVINVVEDDITTGKIDSIEDCLDSEYLQKYYNTIFYNIQY